MVLAKNSVRALIDLDFGVAGLEFMRKRPFATGLKNYVIGLGRATVSIQVCVLRPIFRRARRLRRPRMIHGIQCSRHQARLLGSPWIASGRRTCPTKPCSLDLSTLRLGEVGSDAPSDQSWPQRWPKNQRPAFRFLTVFRRLQPRRPPSRVPYN